MRLIDAKAALEKIYLAGEAIKEYSGRFYEGKYNGLQCAYEIINDMPTVEERKHGRWIRNGDIISCSECILDMYWDEGNAELNYCPYCGAIMDGEE